MLEFEICAIMIDLIYLNGMDDISEREFGCERIAMVDDWLSAIMHVQTYK